MKTSIIQLDPDDDVISIRDKIAWSKTSRILFVWPLKDFYLGKKDLLLTLRACQQQGAQMALVVEDKEVTYLAQELGIPVFASLRRAQRVSWRRPRSKKVIHSSHQPGSIPQKEQKLNQVEWLEKKVVRAGTFAIGVIAVLALLILFLPEATITLYPQRELQTLTLEIRPDTKLSSVTFSGGVPALLQSVVVEGEDSMPSTGFTRVAVRNATGIVVLTNLTEETMQLPAGGIVSTHQTPAIRFRTVEPVLLMGRINAKTEVKIEALQPGALGNVPALEIQAVEGFFGSKVVVSNPAATSGGTDQSSPSPSPADNASLREKILAKLQQTAIGELKGKIQPNFILEPSVKLNAILQETVEPAPGTPSEDLRTRIRAEYGGWEVKEKDLLTIAKQSLDAALSENLKADEATIKINFENPAINDEGATRWQMTAYREVELKMNTDQMILMIRGKIPSDAIPIMESLAQFRQPPEIRISPSWWPFLPFLTFRISVMD